MPRRNASNKKRAIAGADVYKRQRVQRLIRQIHLCRKPVVPHGDDGVNGNHRQNRLCKGKIDPEQDHRCLLYTSVRQEFLRHPITAVLLVIAVVDQHQVADASGFFTRGLICLLHVVIPFLRILSALCRIAGQTRA